MKKRNGSPLIRSSGMASLGASLICILIGLVFGFIILVVLAAVSGDGKNFGDILATAWNSGFQQILSGGFFLAPLGVGQEVAAAAPLIMTGLSVAFAFRTGLFNIGSAGQYVLGAFGALFSAIVLGWPWWACLLTASVFGAVWGAIPGIFKAYLNINEVITSIMFNWIGLYAVNTIIYGGGTGVMYDSSKTKTWDLRVLYSKSVIPDLGMSHLFRSKSTTIAIFLAIMMAVLIHIIINKTTFGYELKACGYNKNAARYAGINEKRSIILSMVIAGALAGFGAGLYFLSGMAEWKPMESTALPAIGFNGIAVALLASNNPIGAVFSAAFISHISTGGSYMNANVFPPEVADIISGIIIYLCAFSLLFRTMILNRRQRKREGTLVQGDETPADLPSPKPVPEPESSENERKEGEQ